MFAGGALAEPAVTTAATKALKIASAYFTKLIIPAVNNLDSARFLNGASTTQQGQWLGLLIFHSGYRLPGEDGYDPAKDIDDLPVVHLAGGAANWNRAPQNIDIEQASEVQDFINGLTRDAAAFAAALSS